MSIQISETLTLKESVVANYFSSINQEEFEQTADLFSKDGTLLAPFEKPIVGREAIANYLAKEAKGMKLIPKEEIREATPDEFTKIQIVGKVKTSLFSVNVTWYFSLNQAQQISVAKIKLIASPQELLGLQKTRKTN